MKKNNLLLRRIMINRINRKKSFTGVVTSNKMEKTVTVLVERLVKHNLYQRIVKSSKRFYAHDEKNECQIGDKVRIEETRPLSKNKRWKISQILEKSN